MVNKSKWKQRIRGGYHYLRVVYYDGIVTEVLVDT